MKLRSTVMAAAVLAAFAAGAHAQDKQSQENKQQQQSKQHEQRKQQQADKPLGTDWSGSFDSVQVGPKATVTVYDNENYTQKVATYKPGQRIADLGETRGFFEDIRSLKIACAGSAATGGTQQSQRKQSPQKQSQQKQ